MKRFVSIVTGLVITLLAWPGMIQAGPTFWGTAAKGMAGAYTAAPGGFSGISYNPASSASVTDYEFTSNFTRLSQNTLDVNNGSVGLGFGVGRITQGIAINRTSISFDFENFDVTSEGLNLDFDDNVVYYNASVQPFASTRLGINAKYFQVQSSVEDAEADGFGVDLGFQQQLNRYFIVGASVINLGAERDWETGLSEDVPTRIRSGVRVRPLNSLSFELNTVHEDDRGLEAFIMGSEWWLVRRIPSADNRLVGVALRSGVEVQQVEPEEVNLSLGFSFKMGFGEFHYAFQEKSNFENQQQFGLSMKFGGPSY
jgi:hypothetical protein